MESINIVDPKTGQAHAIPYDMVPNALKAGGQFADNMQKERAIMLQHSMAQSQNIEQPGLLGKALEGYKNYAGGILRGAGQGFGDIGASVGNLGISGLEHLSGRKLPHIPHPNLINEHPGSFGESVGQTLGQLVPAITPGVGGFKAASLIGKGAPAVAKLLAGAGAGAATGYASNEDNRNLGAGLGAAGGLLGAAAPIAKSFTLGSIGKNISKLEKEKSAKYREIYDSILKRGESGEKLNIPDMIKNPNEKTNILFEHADTKLLKSIRRFEANPTLKNAHEAQSDLGKIKRAVELKQLSQKPLASGENNVPSIAGNLQKRIHGVMQQHFVDTGKQDLAKEYQQATKGYAKEVVPFKNEAIGEFKKGESSHAELAKSLLANKKFIKSSAAKEIPGFHLRSRLEPSIRFGKNAAKGLAIVEALKHAGVPGAQYLEHLIP